MEAPIPLSVVKAFVVVSTIDEKSVEKLVLRFLGKKSGLKVKVEGRLFKPSKVAGGLELRVGDAQVPEARAVDYPRIYALGGALFASYYATKNGSKSTASFKALFCSGEASFTGDEEGICNYLNGDRSSVSALGSLYSELLEESVKCDDAGELRHIILEVLRNGGASDPAFGDECAKLVISLEGLVERTTTKTVEEILSVEV